jgi:carbon monoxide dehydrogenase subunit G
MDNLSHFESRTGRVLCNAQEVFRFVTDIRNFEQFIPSGTITNWQSEKESCSFTVSMIGAVSFRLSEKVSYKKVVYTGDALKMNGFSLVIDITGEGADPAEVKLFLSADLNPVLKMMAAKPIDQFLEILILEMENFTGWKNIKG